MTIKRMLTLLLFAGTIGLFVAIHSGYLSEIVLSPQLSLQLSPNGGALEGITHTKREDSLRFDTIFLDHTEFRPMAHMNPRYRDERGREFYLIKRDTSGRVLMNSTQVEHIMRSSKVMPLFERVIIKDSIYYRRQQ